MTAAAPSIFASPTCTCTDDQVRFDWITDIRRTYNQELEMCVLPCNVLVHSTGLNWQHGYL